MKTKILKTDLKGKIRNLPGFTSEALLPLFEAVVNSIQAIKEKGNNADGKIEVEILRDEQTTMPLDDEDVLGKIVGFNVIDNGIGFNNENFESFETSDTSHKLAIGGRGIGRFLWLKAFSCAKIESVYTKDGSFYKRNISFSSDGIDSSVPEIVQADDTKTIVRLLEFKSYYQELPSAYKKTQKIAQRILEHCLSYFISGEAPIIIVRDSSESIMLNAEYDNKIRNNFTKELLTIGKYEFCLFHIKLFATHAKMHEIVLCANGRDVESISLAKALGTSTQFDDESKRFIYSLYVTSNYLDNNVSGSRLGFEIPEDLAGQMFDDEFPSISKSQITTVLVKAAKVFLEKYLEISKAVKIKNLESFVSANPALRFVFAYKKEEVLAEIEPESKATKIAEVLYRFKGINEYEVQQKSEKLLKTQFTSLQEFNASYKPLQDQISSLQKDDLISYLCHRRCIIELLEKHSEWNKDKKYSNEKIVHDIIFPRKANSDLIPFEAHNLWLIDEHLAFHSFACSDLSAGDENDRPDITIYAEIDDEKNARAVSLIELKKPMRPDDNPIEQLLDYVEKIRDKNFTLPNGRKLTTTSDTRFFCYAICDINEPILRYIRRNGNFYCLQENRGYYAYNKDLNATIEVRDFDKVVIDAKHRHRAFFQRLGIDSVEESKKPEESPSVIS